MPRWRVLSRELAAQAQGLAGEGKRQRLQRGEDWRRAVVLGTAVPHCLSPVSPRQLDGWPPDSRLSVAGCTVVKYGLSAAEVCALLPALSEVPLGFCDEVQRDLCGSGQWDELPTAGRWAASSGKSRVLRCARRAGRMGGWQVPRAWILFCSEGKRCSWQTDP